MQTDLRGNKVVPVAVLKDETETKEAFECLKEGGLNAVEITYRTPYAGKAIAYGRKYYPDMFVGAGTVINVKQCKDAVASGAQFIVGPGFSEKVAKYCKKANVPYIPGVITPTEIMAARNLGVSVMKFFPYSTFGALETVRAYQGPFADVSFMLTNGIDGDNFAELLKEKNVVAVGGSWMLKGSKEEKTAKIKRIADALKKEKINE